MTKIVCYAKATIVLIVALLAVNSVKAQDKEKRVVFESNSMLISDMMSDIERQTSFRFAFDKNVFDTSRKVSFPKLEMSLDEALRYMVEGQKVGYTIHNQYVAIFFKEEKKPDPTPKKTELPPPPVIPDYTSYSIASPESYFKTGSPVLNVKTDLLYAAASQAVNAAAEIAVGRKTTLELSLGGNFWNKSGDKRDNRKLWHVMVRPEFRYWLCERFNGHFLGVNATYGRYDISRHNMLWMFDKEFRYDGNAWGAGITYGYHYMLNKRWGLELTVGVGFAAMSYDKYESKRNGALIEHENDFYFGPTRAGISIVYLIK